MTTSTLELIDWATCLDAAPVCEEIDGCGNPAEHAARYRCGCSVLFCAGCTRDLVAYLGSMTPCDFRCDRCSRLVRAATIRDLVTVVPL